ncbi:MAG: hypothetical protein IT576_03555 [Verrucomicrobiales bacterium]|nr:hypothetical protein [Verrucomicrobiales bacterium]
MAQPPLNLPPDDRSGSGTPALLFFPAALAGKQFAGPLVVVVDTPIDFCRWLNDAPPEVQWLQVEGLLGEPEIWATAARKASAVALDVVLSQPGTEFSGLYRLADVRNVRDVRVTLPVAPGFSKALRLASALQLPVRLLPGQPNDALVEELLVAVDFYLHDPSVEAPVEFFHSFLASQRGVLGSDLWMILEQDPDEYRRHDQQGAPIYPEGALPSPTRSGFVTQFEQRLAETGAECSGCRWQSFCRGYFKWPNPDYACAGIIRVFDALAKAAGEMETDLAAWQPPPQEPTQPPAIP